MELVSPNATWKGRDRYRVTAATGTHLSLSNDANPARTHHVRYALVRNSYGVEESAVKVWWSAVDHITRGAVLALVDVRPGVTS